MPALIAVAPSGQVAARGRRPDGGGSCSAQAAASSVTDSDPSSSAASRTSEVERLLRHLTDVLAYPRKRMRLTDLVTPLKPLEAMAQRRLVAASDVGGHRELIRDGDTGTLFAPDDPTAIAAALARMFADRGDWDARRDRARRFVAQDRNWSSNISRYIPVYQRLATAAQMDGSWSHFPAFKA